MQRLGSIGNGFIFLPLDIEKFVSSTTSLTLLINSLAESLIQTSRKVESASITQHRMRNLAHSFHLKCCGNIRPEASLPSKRMVYFRAQSRTDCLTASRLDGANTSRNILSPCAIPINQAPSTTGAHSSRNGTILLIQLCSASPYKRLVIQYV